MLRNTVQSMGAVKLADDHQPHGTPLGELLFPTSKNAVGIVLDALSKQGR